MLNRLFVLLTISSSLTWTQPLYSAREHSLSKPYQGSGMTIPNWDFAGTTIVTSNYIRLTPDEQSRRGSLWNSVPLSFRNWEVHLEFRVSGKGKDLFGDGMAFWYAKQPLVSGPVFGNEELFNGLGVFLDTYANQNGAHSHGHPYISAMVNNGSVHYDHDRDGTHSELAGCESKFRGSEHDSYLSIRYEGDVLTVSTDISGKNEWAECFKVSGVQLPTNYFIGVTAATGDLSDNHDVISIKTYELEVSEADRQQGDRSSVVPSAMIHAAARDHVHDPPPASSVLRTFFIVVFSLIGITAVVAVGYYFYTQNAGRKKNRFY